MSLTDIAIIGGYGAVGFLAVFFFLTKLKTAPKGGKSDRPQGEREPRKAEEGEKKWFEVLEVAENSQWQTIKAAYLQKIGRYHPDKFESFGDDFRRVAEVRAKRLNEALDTAKKLRNIREG